MPFVKFSYPVDGQKVGVPVHVGADKADAYVRDGVAVHVDPPAVDKPKADAKQGPPKEELKQADAKPAVKAPAKRSE